MKVLGQIRLFLGYELWPNFGSELKLNNSKGLQIGFIGLGVGLQKLVIKTDLLFNTIFCKTPMKSVRTASDTGIPIDLRRIQVVYRECNKSFLKLLNLIAFWRTLVRVRSELHQNTIKTPIVVVTVLMGFFFLKNGVYKQKYIWSFHTIGLIGLRRISIPNFGDANRILLEFRRLRFVCFLQSVSDEVLIAVVRVW